MNVTTIGDTTIINRESLTEGAKFDTGKCRFDLLPLDALWETGKVYTMGANKYADRNWEKGIKYGRVISALCRHLFKWWCGEKYDQEDGQHHLASVVWCGLALLHYDLNPKKYAEFDDRPGDHVRVWEPAVIEPPSIQTYYERQAESVGKNYVGGERKCMPVVQTTLFPLEELKAIGKHIAHDGTGL
jgi:hypothetical protein